MSVFPSFTSLFTWFKKHFIPEACRNRANLNHMELCKSTKHCQSINVARLIHLVNIYLHITSPFIKLKDFLKTQIMLTLWYIKNTKSAGMFPVMDMTAGMSTFLMGQMPALPGRTDARLIKTTRILDYPN